MLTLGSLFDGLGTWQLVAKRHGIKPLWSSEVDDYPMAVSKYHFPDTKQLGDITKIDVDTLEPADIITCSSPCQDLSVAGRREGLAGARSGLFKVAIELVHRLRERTGKPRFFVWENVVGSLTSNKGLDFRTVIEEITKAEIPMPKVGRWATSGLVEWGGASSLAWRTLDAQYWGVPQRRRRIFLVADFGGRSAGEILFERKGLQGDSEQGEETQQGTTERTRKGVDFAVYDMTHADEVLRPIGGKMCSLNARMGTGGNQIPIITLFEDRHDEGVRFMKDNKSNTLTASMGTGGQCASDTREQRC